MLGLIEKYRDCLPLPADAEAISLCEGATPLIQLRNIPKLFDIDLELYVKYEGLNPTGSFKDRGMTVAVSHASCQKNKKRLSVRLPATLRHRQQLTRRELEYAALC